MVDAADPTRRTRATHDYEPLPTAMLVKTRREPWDDAPVATSETTASVGLKTTFTDSKSLASEILQLKDELAKPNADPTLKMELTMRQAEWIQKARAEGQPEPRGALDPFTATPRDVARAVVWSNVGGVIPRSELEKDGGHAYQASVRDAVAMQTGGLDALLALHGPNEQRELLRRAVTSLGGKAPADATVDDLRTAARDASLAKKGAALVADAHEQERRKYIGLDGRIATEDRLVRYERQQALDAMYPQTTIGSIIANAPNVVSPKGAPCDVERMRSVGQAADSAENGFGHLAEPSEPPRPRPSR